MGGNSGGSFGNGTLTSFWHAGQYPMESAASVVVEMRCPQKGHSNLNVMDHLLWVVA